MKKILSTLAAAVLLAAPALEAQTLLTSTFGGTQATNIIGSCPSGYCFGAGPVAIGTNGFNVTYTASSSSSLLSGPGGGYGLASNGYWSNLAYAATNGSATVRFDFGSAVTSVGGWMNYAPGHGGPALLLAYDGSNNLVASYDLTSLAPIVTSGQDQAAFRGISYAGGIKAFEIQGGYILTQDLSATNTTVPEPSSVALMGAGLAGLVAVRRRKRAS